MDRDEADKHRAAIHEAGHAMAYVHLGESLDEVEITATQDAAAIGEYLWVGQVKGKVWKNRERHNPIIGLAGPIAEILDRAIRDDVDPNDLEEWYFYNLLEEEWDFSMSANDKESANNRLDEEVVTDALRLVRGNWEMLVEMAGILTKRERLTEAEIMEFYHLHGTIK